MWKTSRAGDGVQIKNLPQSAEARGAYNNTHKNKNVYI